MHAAIVSPETALGPCKFTSIFSTFVWEALVPDAGGVILNNPSSYCPETINRPFESAHMLTQELSSSLAGEYNSSTLKPGNVVNLLAGVAAAGGPNSFKRKFRNCTFIGDPGHLQTDTAFRGSVVFLPMDRMRHSDAVDEELGFGSARGWSTVPHSIGVSRFFTIVSNFPECLCLQLQSPWISGDPLPYQLFWSCSR